MRSTSPPANVPATPLPTTYIGKETRERQTVSDFPEEAPRIDNEELDPTLRGFFRIPGIQTLVNLRGFVKTDLFYDLNMAGFWYGGMVPSSFPIKSPTKIKEFNGFDTAVAVRSGIPPTAGQRHSQGICGLGSLWHQRTKYSERPQLLGTI